MSFKAEKCNVRLILRAGCPEWEEAKKYIKQTKLTVKAQKVALQERQRQRIALENKRNDEIAAAKERIEANLRVPEEGHQDPKKRRRFAALFDDAAAEGEREAATETELREGLQESRQKRRFAGLFNDTEAETEAGSPPQTSKAFPPQLSHPPQTNLANGSLIVIQFDKSLESLISKPDPDKCPSLTFRHFIS